MEAIKIYQCIIQQGVGGEEMDDENRFTERRISRVEEDMRAVTSKISTLESSNAVIAEKLNYVTLSMDKMSLDVQKSNNALVQSLEKHQIAMDKHQVAMDTKIDKMRDDVFDNLSRIEDDIYEKSKVGNKLWMKAGETAVIVVITVILAVIGISVANTKSIGSSDSTQQVK